MRLSDIQLSVIKDSRGVDTLQARMNGEGFDVCASVPSGKSTGEHEATVVEPAHAVSSFSSLRADILSQDFENQEMFDGYLLKLDGTPNKSALGANTTLALSIAFARAWAALHAMPLYKSLALLVPEKESGKTFPRPFFNVINGGAHVSVPDSWRDASGRMLRLDLQEFQVIPQTDDFGIALGMGQEFYKKLKEFLVSQFGAENVRVGDEAGFYCPFSSNEEALGALRDVIGRFHYPMRIGLDAAGTQIYRDGSYELSGRRLSVQELLERYKSFVASYDVFSIEDPFWEEAFDMFSQITSQLPQTMIITDDLTTTNPSWLSKAVQEKAGNTLLVKPNQIGTVSETIAVARSAHVNGWKTVVSHRSGETEDDFIADLAMALGSWGIKSGAPATPFRMNKYNRLLAIWQETHTL